MGQNASIKRHLFDEKDESKGVMYALSPGGTKDFIDDCIRTDRDRLRGIVKTAKRIYDRGCSYGRASETIKRIHAGQNSIDVFETRVKGTVVRVATYIYEDWIPIYLFDFDTHPGTGNNLPKHHIDRAVKMAKIAEECAKDYDFSEYKGAH